MRKMNLAVLGGGGPRAGPRRWWRRARSRPRRKGPGAWVPGWAGRRAWPASSASARQQKEQVRKLMEDQRAEHEALREKLEKNEEQLQAALESANPDPAAVGELAIEGHRLHEQGRALREAQDKAVRALLTPEQQVKFDAMKALREEGGPMGGGRPMGGGAMPPGGGEGWRRP